MSDYAFDGETVRLTQRDFDRWCKSYGVTPDWLTAELQSIDDWYRDKPGEVRKKWFFQTSAMIKKSSQTVQRQTAYERDQEDLTKRNHNGQTPSTNWI